MTKNLTAVQQRLNDDFDAIFGSHCLPAIEPPTLTSPGVADEQEPPSDGQISRD